MNCFDISLILSRLSSVLCPFSSVFVVLLRLKLLPFNVVLNDMLVYCPFFIDLKLALVLLKLNFEASWFFGEVKAGLYSFVCRY